MKYTDDEIEDMLSQADHLCELERFDEAYLLDLRAAKAGSVRAMTHVGWYYENGLGTDHNPAKAFIWYQQAAETGDADAQYCLGTCYENGTGVDIDLDKARRYFSLAAAQEQDDAIEALIRLKQKADASQAKYSAEQLQRMATEAQRYYTMDDFDNAIRVATVAAEAGNAEAQYVLAQCFDDGTLEHQRWLRAAAESGLAPAMTDLGVEIEEENPSEAVVWYLRAADKGFGRAYYNLGLVYDEGIGVTVNKAKALEYFTKAYDEHFVASATQIGFLYLDDEDVESDKAKAFYFFKIGAENGDEDAMNQLAQLYYDGVDNVTESNYELALSWWERAVAAGSDDAMVSLADILLKEADTYDRGIALLRQAVDLDNDDAMVTLAQEYLEAPDFLEDDSKYINPKKAIGLLERACQADNGMAHDVLGDCYLNGNGVKENDRKAVGLYQKAADLGYSRAYVDLALCYSNGDGVPQDEKHAFKLMQQAVEMDEDDAFYHLGMFYKFGTGTKENNRLAFEYLTKAVDREVTDAFAALAYYYENGNLIGMPVNERRACELYKEGLERGDDSAKAQVAFLLIYANDSFVKSVSEGINMMQEAAEEDDEWAMYNMGLLYEEGEHVQRDIAKARQWYRRAADAGSEDAEEALDNL